MSSSFFPGFLSSIFVIDRICSRLDRGQVLPVGGHGCLYNESRNWTENGK